MRALLLAGLLITLGLLIQATGTPPPPADEPPSVYPAKADPAPPIPDARISVWRG
ncbi:hypothetical protein [Rubrivirga sp. SAORIC476]|uniref:hypothetical protein n=1 Tax=Rubrivirga sp. SAORIC476 TaxID=1961794 RepID=UPI0013041BC9|nr:hypothetical protein [Rubrivirga sp. SAORIC476]